MHKLVWRNAGTTPRARVPSILSLLQRGACRFTEQQLWGEKRRGRSEGGRELEGFTAPGWSGKIAPHMTPGVIHQEPADPELQ